MEINNLLLSLFINLPKKELLNFIISFRKYNLKDDIVILMNKETEEECKDIIIKYNIKIIPYLSYAPDIFWLFHQRHYYYLNYLKNNKYKKVIISDSTDVVFQENPFNKINENFYLFEEGINIGEEYINTKWIIDYFNIKTFNNLKGKNILCGGIIAGYYNRILAFERLISYILSKKHGIDQVILNFIGHNNKYTKTINGEIVANIALLLSNKNLIPDIRDDGYYLNNFKPAIVHQYTRNKKLKTYFNELFN